MRLLSLALSPAHERQLFGISCYVFNCLVQFKIVLYNIKMLVFLVLSNYTFQVMCKLSNIFSYVENTVSYSLYIYSGAWRCRLVSLTLKAL